MSNKTKLLLIFSTFVLSKADDEFKSNKHWWTSLCFHRALRVTGKLFFWQDPDVDAVPARHQIAKVLDKQPKFFFLYCVFSEAQEELSPLPSP